MNLRITILNTPRSKVPQGRETIIILQRLPQYMARATLGLVGGAAGVALAMALAIGVQALLVPPATFSPGLIPFTLIAAILGLGVSWLLSLAARRILPNLFYNAEQGLQMIFVFSIFISLLEAFIFRPGL